MRNSHLPFSALLLFLGVSILFVCCNKQDDNSPAPQPNQPTIPELLATNCGVYVVGVPGQSMLPITIYTNDKCDMTVMFTPYGGMVPNYNVRIKYTPAEGMAEDMEFNIGMFMIYRVYLTRPGKYYIIPSVNSMDPAVNVTNPFPNYSIVGPINDSVESIVGPMNDSIQGIVGPINDSINLMISFTNPCVFPNPPCPESGISIQTFAGKLNVPSVIQQNQFSF
jgi:hypothetical protein